jgi:hypothetical protein
MNSTSYSLEKFNIPLWFYVVPRRTVQTNHGDVVFLGFNVQRRRLNALGFKFDFFIMIEIIFNCYRTTTSGCISGMRGVVNCISPEFDEGLLSEVFLKSDKHQFNLCLELPEVLVDG